MFPIYTTGLDLVSEAAESKQCPPLLDVISFKILQRLKQLFLMRLPLPIQRLR